ncbi:MAG: hypothetical protein PHU42_03295 [Patescibacteria group bacterium]|nr:hypothetical protein [Patescibacteria group bacterium]
MSRLEQAAQQAEQFSRHLSFWTKAALIILIIVIAELVSYWYKKRLGDG